MFTVDSYSGEAPVSCPVNFLELGPADENPDWRAQFANQHFVIFGCDVRRSIPRPFNRSKWPAFCKPCDFQVFAWIEGKHHQIKSFNSSGAEIPSLANTFGPSLFEERRLPELKFLARGNRTIPNWFPPNPTVSIAELINLYMDYHCSFRLDPLSKADRSDGHPDSEHVALLNRGLGARLCHLELELQRLVESNAPANFEDLGVSFTFVSAATGRIEPLPCRRIGGLGLPSTQHHFSKLFRHPIAGGDPTCEQVSFVDCFSTVGRQYLLPSEVSESSQHFSSTELRTYLLYWVILRALKRDNVDFLKHLRSVLESPSIATAVAVQALLETRIVLSESDVFDSEALGKLGKISEETSLNLLLPDRSFAFRAILERLGLLNDTVADLAANELRSFFGKGPTGRDGLRSLDMYKRAGWKWQSGAASTQSPSPLESSLCCILQTVMADIPIDSPSFFKAVEEHLKHATQRSVIPLGLILMLLPSTDASERLIYTILPVFEELVRHPKRSQYLPVICAHIVDRLDWKIDSPTRQHLEASIAAIGPDLAHNYLAEERSFASQSQRKAFGLEAVQHVGHGATNELKHPALEQLLRTAESSSERNQQRLGAAARMALGRAIGRCGWLASALDRYQQEGEALRTTSIPGKFLSTCDVQLESLVSIVKTGFDFDLKDQPSLKIEILPNLHPVTLAKGYVDDSIIIGVVADLLDNVRKHGLTSFSSEGKPYKKVSLCWAVDPANSSVDIVVESSIGDHDLVDDVNGLMGEGVSDRTRGLELWRSFLEMCGLGANSLSTFVRPSIEASKPRSYVAVLSLKPISYVPEHGDSAQVQVVSPHFSFPLQTK